MDCRSGILFGLLVGGLSFSLRELWSLQDESRSVLVGCEEGWEYWDGECHQEAGSS